jgi:hypothetical protein
MSAIEQKAREWLTWVEAVRLTHYARGDTFRKRNNEIGLAAVVFSTIISAGILTSLHRDPGFWWTLAAAIVALLAAGLTGIRSYLKLGDLSEAHRIAGAKFGAVARELELFLCDPPGPQASTAQLDQIARQIAKLEEAGPGFPAKVFRQKHAAVEKAHKTP